MNFGNTEFTFSCPENRRPWAVVDIKLVTSEKSKSDTWGKNFNDDDDDDDYDDDDNNNKQTFCV